MNSGDCILSTSERMASNIMSNSAVIVLLNQRTCLGKSSKAFEPNNLYFSLRILSARPVNKKNGTRPFLSLCKNRAYSKPVETNSSFSGMPSSQKLASTITALAFMELSSRCFNSAPSCAFPTTLNPLDFKSPMQMSSRIESMSSSAHIILTTFFSICGKIFNINIECRDEYIDYDTPLII